MRGFGQAVQCSVVVSAHSAACCVRNISALSASLKKRGAATVYCDNYFSKVTKILRLGAIRKLR